MTDDDSSRFALHRERLQQRAALLARLRAFFAARGFVEVATPLLCDEVIPELHIEPIAVEGRWLQASPELSMKRLLAEGMPAIVQIGPAFRRGEHGRLHNPEFTMVEWYRVGDDFVAGVSLLAELCRELLGGDVPITQTAYADALATHAGIDPHQASLAELARASERLAVVVPADMPEDRDEWLNLLLAAAVEPRLGAAGPEILCDYPPSQAALAATRIDPQGNVVAERFELYWRGVELANGYHELTDGTELRRRFEEVNARRVADGRAALPLPEKFLAAHARLPPCSGCALGFDRLAMLASGAGSIAEVMTFAWEE
ncbi:MAG: EF-P lysine aminoacylase GenX [Pirellulales bacterium]|nr:EF-P lysine aminoacylase GenX [Pirellulales bacterium]